MANLKIYVKLYFFKTKKNTFSDHRRKTANNGIAVFGGYGSKGAVGKAAIYKGVSVRIYISLLKMGVLSLFFLKMCVLSKIFKSV